MLCLKLIIYHLKKGKIMYSDIEKFLFNSTELGEPALFYDEDWIEYNLEDVNFYPDSIMEISEIVLGHGCFQKKRKEIYDESEYLWQ